MIAVDARCGRCLDNDSPGSPCKCTSKTPRGCCNDALGADERANRPECSLGSWVTLA